MTGLVVAVLAHIAAGLFVLTYAPARDALRKGAPLMVTLIKPEIPVPQPPRPEPKVTKLPRALPVKPVQAQPEAEQPVLTVQTTAPTAARTSPPVELKPLAPVELPVAAPAPLIAPNFNADYLHNPVPVYPPLSRRLGEQGRVLVSVLVEADGIPLKVELRTSSGSERLDQSALDAVRRWKFVPAQQGGQAVAAWVVVPVVFSLKG